MLGLGRIGHKQLELAGVEPDAATVDAVVDLDVGQFERDHGTFARGTIHAKTPDLLATTSSISYYRFAHSHFMIPRSAARYRNPAVMGIDAWLTWMFKMAFRDY